MPNMMKELFDALPTNPKLMDAIENGTIPMPRRYFPKIAKVIFNDGVVKDTGEVVERGATIVFFDDGTRTTVRRMDGDTDNKETALLYAIAKRLFATEVNLAGEVTSWGLGRKIQEVVANATWQKAKVIKTKKPDVEEPPKEREIVKPWPKPPKADTEIAVKKAPAKKRGKDGRFTKKTK